MKTVQEKLRLLLWTFFDNWCEKIKSHSITSIFTCSVSQVFGNGLVKYAFPWKMFYTKAVRF